MIDYGNEKDLGLYWIQKKGDVNAAMSYNRKHFTTSCNKYSNILGKLIVDMDITGCGKGKFG